MHKYTVHMTMTSMGKCIWELYDDTNNRLIGTTLANDTLIDDSFIEIQEVIEDDYLGKVGT